MRLSGSKIQLAMLCGYAFSADAVMHEQAPAGQAAALGTAEHELIEQEASGRDEEETTQDAFAELVARDLQIEVAIVKHGLSSAAAEDLCAMHAAWAEWWPEWSQGRAFEREVPFAWDVARWSARRIPSAGHRDYSQVAACEIPLTIDALYVDAASRTGVVVDWKTGRLPQPRATHHAQLLTGALCVAAVHGLQSVTVVVGRVRPGKTWTDEATVYAFELDEWAAAVQSMHEGLTNAEPTPGRHCTELHCHALSACEGPRALARLAPELAKTLPVIVESEPQAAAVFASRKAVQAYLDALDRAAEAWGAAHGRRVCLATRAWAPVTNTRRSIDLARAEAEVRKMFPDRADSMIRVKRSLSVAEVQKAAAAGAPRGKKGDASEAAIARIEASGGLKLTTFEKWQEEI